MTEAFVSSSSMQILHKRVKFKSKHVDVLGKDGACHRYLHFDNNVIISDHFSVCLIHFLVPPRGWAKIAGL